MHEQLAADKVFPYPVRLDHEQRDTLIALVEPVDRCARRAGSMRLRLCTVAPLMGAAVRYFAERIDSRKIDAESRIPAETLRGLAEMGLFGLQIPEEYGGLGLSNTKFARVIESVSQDGSVAVTLLAHQSIGLKGILMFGNERQKTEYLPKLASGEHIAAFALTEPSRCPAQRRGMRRRARISVADRSAAPWRNERGLVSGSDAASIRTRATLSADQKYWILNGSKIWISNGGLANVFTVFARTEVKGHDGQTRDRITAFIVERDFGGTRGSVVRRARRPAVGAALTAARNATAVCAPAAVAAAAQGITSGKPEDKLGIRGSNTTEVHFADCRVPVENVLGEVGEGFKVAVKILNSGRYGLGIGAAGNSKKLLKLAVAHATTRTQFGRKLCEFELIQEKLARMAISAYAMESMAYLTTAMTDAGQGDCAVEAAMCKVYGSESVWTNVNETLQILGGQGYMKAYPVERYLRDSRILTIFEGANEILRLFIALTSVQALGRELAQIRRSPLGSLGDALHYARLYVGLGRAPPVAAVHAALRAQAQLLSRHTAALGTASLTLLQQHGSRIVDQQLQLRRLADIAIDLFAGASVLSRASQSLQRAPTAADHELALARAFFALADRRIRENLHGIRAGRIASGDADLARISGQICSAGSYLAPHPLGVPGAA